MVTDPELQKRLKNLEYSPKLILNTVSGWASLTAVRVLQT